MKINAYVNFNGKCKDAVAFYSKAFGVKPNITTLGEMPSDKNNPLSDETKKLIAHAEIDLNGNHIMFCDIFPGMDFLCGNNISIMINSGNKEQLTTWFKNLSEGGKIVMPLGEVFWSKFYGCTVDKFGICWQVDYTEDEK